MAKPVDLNLSRLTGEKEEPQASQTQGPAKPKKQKLEADLTEEQIGDLKNKIIEKLHTCFDPEIPVNIYELGLIYDIIIEPDGAVNILMTLTTPACPVAGSLPGEVETKVLQVDNVTTTKVDLVWDPPWDKDRMSEAAKLQLGMDDW